ncbi:MAG: DUF3568 family protein [Candidatus Omnitrophota bacterium]|jgi:hypothetical protein
MIKRLFGLMFVTVLLLNFTGCVAVVAGAAGGAGTAFWLEGKIKEEVKAPIPKVVKATTSALKSMRLEITKTTVKDEVAQIKAEYTDKRVVWIDIKKLTQDSSQIEIRVGMKGDKEASTKILERIKRYL